MNRRRFFSALLTLPVVGVPSPPMVAEPKKLVPAITLIVHSQEQGEQVAIALSKALLDAGAKPTHSSPLTPHREADADR